MKLTNGGAYLYQECMGAESKYYLSMTRIFVVLVRDEYALPQCGVIDSGIKIKVTVCCKFTARVVDL